MTARATGKLRAKAVTPMATRIFFCLSLSTGP
jgi:hypothetical protein